MTKTPDQYMALAKLAEAAAKGDPEAAREVDAMERRGAIRGIDALGARILRGGCPNCGPEGGRRPAG